MRRVHRAAGRPECRRKRAESIDQKAREGGTPMTTRSRLRTTGAAITIACLAASVGIVTQATATTAPADSSPVLSKASSAAAPAGLPTVRNIPITASSHPFNGAAWQNVPIDLSQYGYTEKEYLISGKANVYNWIPGGNYQTEVLRSGDYATRMMVRMPKNMKKWSGNVNVEIVNMTAGYDWTAIWSALWERTLKDGDVYIGVTSKANIVPALQAFDAARYADLNWSNPLPPEQQACGRLPGEAGYNPNTSKLYENGLIWDILSQAGTLLKSNSKANPLGKAARNVILSGESQSSGYLLTYYRYFTPTATLANGKPIFDGYFAETLVGNAGAPINQCANTTTPLAADDPQRAAFPERSIPWIGINSQWDYPGVRNWTTPADANTATHKARFWELAGSNHGWEWQYLYGDANAEDLIKSGFDDPATYAWSCGVNNPEVPFYMAEKAAYEALKKWISTGKAPARAPRILTWASGVTDRTLYDPLNNGMGGIRYPMVAVPVASFGAGQYTLSGDCTGQIVPFDEPTLSALYPSKGYYLAQYKAATDQLVKDGFLLKDDVSKLLALAAANTSIPTQGS